MVARSVLDGGMPYRDAFDFKPPGIFLIYALARALFGPAQWGIRVLEVAGPRWHGHRDGVGSPRAWLGDRRIGVVAAALAVLVHAQLDFWHTAQPESFGGMLTIAALLVATPRGRDGRRPEPRHAAPRWSRRARSSAPPASSSRPSPGAAPCSPSRWPRRPRRSSARRGSARAAVQRRSDAGPTAIQGEPAGSAPPASAGPLGGGRAPLGGAPARLLIALGGVLPLLACAAWFALEGALGDLRGRCSSSSRRTTPRSSWVGESVLKGMTWYGFYRVALQHTAARSRWASCSSSRSRRTPPPRAGGRRAARGRRSRVHLAGVIMQAKFFPYHYGATWPLTGDARGARLLEGVGPVRPVRREAARAWRSSSRRSPLVVLVSLRDQGRSRPLSSSAAGKRLALLTHAARGPGAPSIASPRSPTSTPRPTGRSPRSCGRACAPGRPVFVWGFEPVIYDLADRTPATRYLYDVPQRASWAKEEARAALMRDLAAGRPAAIVVERHDVFPMVTGDAIDSGDTLKGFPALRGSHRRALRAAP